LLAERSPINKVENIKKPMLIFHGANDVRCKVAKSDTIVAAMRTQQHRVATSESDPKRTCYWVAGACRLETFHLLGSGSPHAGATR